MLVTLVVVIGIILYLSYLFSRFVAKSSLRIHGKGKGIRILDRAAVGTDRSIDIIQVNQRYFLIGNTATNMVCLAELSEEDIAFYQEGENKENDGSPFQAMLFEKIKEKTKR